MANRRSVLKLFLLIFLAQYSIQTALAQTPQRLRSTLSIGGSSKTFTAKGKHCIVQQSIGQSSVIDSYQANGFVLRQGFIQPLMSASKVDPKQTTLQASVCPNPFSSNIKVSFSEAISDNLYVTLTDLSGRMQFSNRFEVTQQLSFEVSTLASGLYILRVTSGKKSFATKLAKE